MTYQTRKDKAIALKNDFEYYAKNCLFIRPKSGKVEPFVLNKAQRYIQQRLEEQLEETGRIRAIILKGRQQGCSTLIEGRFYWKITQTNGARAFILTHEQEATNNLFDMVNRYHENCPSYLKPSTAAANFKELKFDKIDSGYKVGTAGTKGVGRSSTVQFMHGSEVAFWPNADEHAKGIMQAIPDADGTEVILESTANGLGNYYHQQWKLAEAGLSDYMAIFIPWYWQDEYRKATDIQPDDKELELAEIYGLDIQQIAWRRAKIVGLSANGQDGEKAFRQEYPMNASEAFQLSGEDGLIKPETVMRARKNRVNGNGPLIVGVDPSRGGDRFVIIKRHGRLMYDPEIYVGDEVDKLGKAVSKCKRVLDTYCPHAKKKPDMMFIDAGGGSDLVDRLHELGYQDRVKAIAFGASPLDDEKYKNRRGEMWGNLNLWLTDENLDVEVPDMDELQADFCASPYDRDSHDRMVLWKKDKIKSEYGFSPDLGDAAALTHAEFVPEIDDEYDEDLHNDEHCDVTGY